jgi:hypothetical protein
MNDGRVGYVMHIDLFDCFSRKIGPFESVQLAQEELYQLKKTAGEMARFDLHGPVDSK